jgi:hypothetical protein
MSIVALMTPAFFLLTVQPEPYFHAQIELKKQHEHLISISLPFEFGGVLYNG